MQTQKYIERYTEIIKIVSWYVFKSYYFVLLIVLQT